MIPTTKLIREELETREHWSAALVLLEMIDLQSLFDADYMKELNRWLSGELSTTHLRDVICEPHRYNLGVVAAGSCFNPGTEWGNTWMPLDTAAHRVRHDLAEGCELEALRSLPGFGAF